MIRVVLLSVMIGVLSTSAENSSALSGDEYITSNQNECFTTHRLLSCMRYKMAKVLWKLATNRMGYFQHEDSRKMDEPRWIRVVQLTEANEMRLSMDARTLKEDSEITRLIKFLKRTAELFARNHGLQFGISSDIGANVISDDTSVVEPRARGDKKKRKWLIILPLIILMKIAHLKMTVVPLLLGIVGLNVLLIGGGGWLIHYLKYKTLCKIHPHLVQSHSHVYDSDPSEYSVFGGSSSYPGGHSAGGYYATHDSSPYVKDWSSSKAYSAYRAYET